MKIRTILAATMTCGALLGSCASQSHVPITETSCVNLDKSMQTAYIVVTTREEALKRAKDSALLQNTSQKTKDQAEQFVIQQKIQPLVYAYRQIEIEYNSRCPKPAPLTAAMKKKYPSRLIH